MTRLVFGQDAVPPGPPIKMAYAGRASCGHVRAFIVDDGREATVDLALSWADQGLTLERIPAEQAESEMGECDVCRPGTMQEGLGLA